MHNLTIDLIYPATALLCAIVGAIYDLRSRRIPNLLTLSAIPAGLLLHLALGGWSQLGSSVAGGLLCGLIFLVFYLAGGMGAGDVKLIAAVGCLAGLPRAGSLLILTALAGGMMAAALALYRRRLKETLRNILALLLHHRFEGLAPHPVLNVDNRQALSLPYALAIAAGSAGTFCLLLVHR